MIDLTDLSLTIQGTPILHDVSLTIARGEIFGLVGESGSGKSMTALSLMRLLPAGSALSGQMTLDETDLVTLPESQMQRLRGNDIASGTQLRVFW